LFFDICPVVTISLTEFFDRTIPSTIFLFPFPHLKTDGTSLFILLFVKNFEGNEIKKIKNWFCQNIPPKWAIIKNINLKVKS